MSENATEPDDDADEIDDTEEPGRGGKTVPYTRFQKVTESNRALKRRVSELEREAQGNAEKAATADTLASQLEKEKRERKGERDGWSQEKAMIGAGLVDDEAREVALLHYNRQPEATRGPLEEWLKGIKADPTKAPKSLRPFLGEAPPADTDTDGADDADAEGAEAVDAGGAGGRGKPTAPPPRRSTRSGADATGATGAGQPLSAKQLKDIREKAQKSGDWSEWKRVTGQGEKPKK